MAKEKKRPQVAGLIKPSVSKPILATIENTLVLKQLGAPQNDDRHTLGQILQDIPGADEIKTVFNYDPLPFVRM